MPFPWVNALFCVSFPPGCCELYQILTVTPKR